MKRVLCLEDLACVGRCSLAAALPVISASGVQACCVPTGLFSTHTAGFGAPARAATDDFAVPRWSITARWGFPLTPF